jgi:glyoxylase I family protein
MQPGQCFIKGIEHVAIATAEPRRLADWYIQCLSFTLVRDTGPTVYIKSPNSFVLEFVKAETFPKKPQIRDEGLRHIAFEVDDLEGAHQQLRSRGVEFADSPISLPGMRLFFFRDPEGNYLHLVQREGALPE